MIIMEDKLLMTNRSVRLPIRAKHRPEIKAIRRSRCQLMLALFNNQMEAHVIIIYHLASTLMISELEKKNGNTHQNKV